jgi:hypothetical protein
MKKSFSYVTPLAIFLFPVLVFAQDAGDLGGLNDFFLTITDFISSTLLPLVFALALLVFVYGIFKYFILGGGDEAARESGKSLMIWGILGLVLIVAVWGIVNLVIDILDSATGDSGLTGDSVDLPTIPGQ